jgi:hypothetical protein
MSTPFTAIYPLIRALLEDTNPEKLTYSNEVLDQQITFGATFIGVDDVTGLYDQTTPLTFDGDLTKKQKLLLALEIATRIVSGKSQEFSHRSPILSVTRKGSRSDLLLKFDEMTRLLNGDDFVLETDTDLDTLLNQHDRLFYGINRALTGYDGH